MLWEKIKNWICKDEIEKINELNNSIAKKDEELSVLNNELNESETIIHDDFETIQKLNAEIDKLEEEKTAVIPQDIFDKANEIKNEYPIANIIYRGYTIQLKDSTIKPEIVVQDFIQILPSHKKWVKEKGLTLSIYLNNNKGIHFGEVINKLMFDIYKEYAPRKVYMTDDTLYGISEQWTPTLDSWYLKKMDCENSTLELMSLFEASGLTGELRSFYWNVCGNTQSGGHSTLYAWDFKNSFWRHIEATSIFVKYSDFYSLPTNKDSADKLNIISVWWSFNSDVARHTFKTDIDSENYNKRQKFKDFIIK